MDEAQKATKLEKISSICIRDKDITKRNPKNFGWDEISDRRKALVDLYLDQVKEKLSGKIINTRRTGYDVFLRIEKTIEINADEARVNFRRAVTNKVIELLGTTSIYNRLPTVRYSRGQTYADTSLKSVSFSTEGDLGTHCFESLLVDLDIEIDEKVIENQIVLRKRRLEKSKEASKRKKLRNQVINRSLDFKDYKIIRGELIKEFNFAAFGEQGQRYLGIGIRRGYDNNSRLSKEVEYLEQAFLKLNVDIPKVLNARMMHKSFSMKHVIGQVIKKYLLLRFSRKEDIVLYLVDPNDEVRELAYYLHEHLAERKS